MKILIVNTSDTYGGAARAAYRLHLSLLACKIDSKMLVQRKDSDDSTVIGPSSSMQKYLSKLRPLLDNIPVHFYKRRSKTLFSPSWLPFSFLANKINAINPDIVHLHWICGGMIRVEDMAKIKAPIVWSLHDNWAFTGGCHIKWDCEKYKNSCGACPRLGSKKVNDLSRRIFNRKQKTFSKICNLTIIGLSHWIENCINESRLFKGTKVVNLPNPIDTHTFKPSDKIQSRELWNLPKDKKLVLFGAISATSDPNKGFTQLSNALDNLNTNEIELVVFGNSNPEDTQRLNFKSHHVGRLHDDVCLVTLYSAADVMVVPSLQENLSNSIMESLACGTPVVGFDIGGNSDMIEHMKTGYLAKPFIKDSKTADTNDLANGIEWILNTPNYDELCRNAREKVQKEFDSRFVAQKYIALYKETLLSH